MLPQPSTLEMVKGGDMEAVAGSGPGLLNSDHHTGPWYLPMTGVAQDPLHPGQNVPSGAPFSDDRTRISSDTATAHGGRHSARVNLASAIPVLFPVPTWQLPKALVKVNLTAWVRCSPSGIKIAPSGGGISSAATATATATAGGAAAGGAAAGRGGGGGATPLEVFEMGAEWEQVTWQLITVNGSAPVHPRSTLMHLALSSPFGTGGKVWVDDLSVVCEHGTAKDPCPAL
jgi:hypothetical protein